MNAAEMEKSLRFVVNEGMKSQCHPMQVMAMLDVIKMDLWLDLRQEMARQQLAANGKSPFKVEVKEGGN